LRWHKGASIPCGISVQQLRSIEFEEQNCSRVIPFHDDLPQQFNFASLIQAAPFTCKSKVLHKKELHFLFYHKVKGMFFHIEL